MVDSMQSAPIFVSLQMVLAEAALDHCSARGPGKGWKTAP
jgi:hypothetical protein